MSRKKILLDLAKEELFAADLLLNNALYRACISRCYYALYYTIQALLSYKNITTRTHRGSLQQFSNYFIKTGDLSEEFSKIVSETLALRKLSDYDETIFITQQQAEITIENAKRFIDEAIQWLDRS
jgi:uncharacterized protein (UPF0332 family)